MEESKSIKEAIEKGDLNQLKESLEGSTHDIFDDRWMLNVSESLNHRLTIYECS